MKKIVDGDVSVKSIVLTIEKHHADAKYGIRRGFNSWEDFWKDVICTPVIVKSWKGYEDEKTGKLKCRAGAPLKGYSLATYKGNHRGKERIEQVFGIGIDLDQKVIAPGKLERALEELGYECLWHTTLSHDYLGHAAYRLIFPLAEPCGPQDLPGWAYTRDQIARKLSEHGADMDPNAKDPSRLWYWPACRDLERYFSGYVRGKRVELLEAIPPTQPPGLPTPAALTQVYTERHPTSSKYDLAWVDKQMQDYLSVPVGQRAAWLGPKARTLGGLLAGGGFEDGVTAGDIAFRMASIAAKNSGRSPQAELKFILGAIQMGMRQPLESKKKIAAKKVPSAPLPPVVLDDGGEIVLQKTNEGRIRKNVSNYSVLLDAYYAGAVFFDELAHRIIIKTDAGYRPFSEKIDRVKANRWIAQTGGAAEWPDIPVIEFRPIVETMAMAEGRKVNLERDRLATASTEGAIAAEDVATEILCAEDTPANRAAITYMLFSYVARLTSPVATDVQGMIVMKSHGNFGKTTFLSILAGEERYILHTGPLHMDARLFNKLSRRGLVELGEGVALERSNIEETKAITTSSRDVVDQKNQIDPVEAIRRWIGVISCNEWPEMRDRRFLPIEVGLVADKAELLEGEVRFPKKRWEAAVEPTLALVYQRIQEGFRWQDILSSYNADLKAVRAAYTEEPTHAGGVRVAVAKLVADKMSAPSTDEVMAKMGFALRDYKSEKKGIINALRYCGFLPGSGRRGESVRWGWKPIKGTAGESP